MSTEFDDLFLKRLDNFCETLKGEALQGFRDAFGYVGSDENETKQIKISMASMAQAKTEVRHRLLEIIKQAKDVRKDLGET